MAVCGRCGDHGLFGFHTFGQKKYCKCCYPIVCKEAEEKRIEKEKEEAEKLRYQKLQEERREKRDNRYKRIKTAIAAGNDAQSSTMGKERWTDYLKDLESKTFVVFDLETTGLDPIENETIEIGAIKVSNGEIVGEFDQLVYPVYGLTQEAMEVNQITISMLKGKPSMEEVLPKFLDFVGNAVLVAHNIDFDMKFLLVDQMNYLDPPYFEYQCIDTLLIAKALWKAGTVPNYKLGTLAQFAGYRPQEAHRALADAKTTYAVLKKESETVIAEAVKKENKTRVRAYVRKNSPCTKQSIIDAFSDVPKEIIESLLDGFKREGKLERIKVDGVYMLEYGTIKEE